ncbi:MAG TPA: PadR family transcriptional regulator, partial [Methanofastidiosum sp.]|nr:PadR family transcriptional regulator [Methanofastidiosum sp.]
IGYPISYIRYLFKSLSVNRYSLIFENVILHMRERKHHGKGFLSFLILWMLRNTKMNGSEITDEIEKRKGRRFSPGTIYPVLKKLKEKGLIIDDEEKRYSLTENGQKELIIRIDNFFNSFYDLEEMRRYRANLK